MTTPKLELTSQRQKISRLLPTDEPPGRPVWSASSKLKSSDGPHNRTLINNCRSVSSSLISRTPRWPKLHQVKLVREAVDCCCRIMLSYRIVESDCVPCEGGERFAEAVVLVGCSRRHYSRRVNSSVAEKYRLCCPLNFLHQCSCFVYVCMYVRMYVW